MRALARRDVVGVVEALAHEACQVAAAQGVVLVPTRTGHVDEMVNDLVATDADPNTVAYFETNLALKKGSEIRQVWRTDEESWIRTQATGGDERPGAVSVEVAFTMGLDQADFGSWVTHRIDLVRDDDAWLVTNVTFRSLDYMPAEGASISQALDGEGWRATRSG